VISAGYRRDIHAAARVFRWLVDVVVVIFALTPVVVLAGLAILLLLIPVLPDSWTDSWVQLPTP